MKLGSPCGSAPTHTGFSACFDTHKHISFCILGLSKQSSNLPDTGIINLAFIDSAALHGMECEFLDVCLALQTAMIPERM